MFKHNNYRKNFVKYCINKLLNKLFMQEDLNFIVPTIDFTFV